MADAQAPAEPKRPVVFFQDLCLKHKNTKSKDEVERPERITAVQYAVAALLARLEFAAASTSAPAAASAAAREPGPVTLVRSTAALDDLLHNRAARELMGIKDEADPHARSYAEKLWDWCTTGEWRIPAVRDQYERDLFRACAPLCCRARNSDILWPVCSQSYDAFAGAVATVCEAIDTVAQSSSSLKTAADLDSSQHLGTRAFVVVRPPGHHCTAVSTLLFVWWTYLAEASHAHQRRRWTMSP